MHPVTPSATLISLTSLFGRLGDRLVVHKPPLHFFKSDPRRLFRRRVNARLRSLLKLLAASRGEQHQAILAVNLCCPTLFVFCFRHATILLEKYRLSTRYDCFGVRDGNALRLL